METSKQEVETDRGEDEANKVNKAGEANEANGVGKVKEVNEMDELSGLGEGGWNGDGTVSVRVPVSAIIDSMGDAAGWAVEKAAMEGELERLRELALEAERHMGKCMGEICGLREDNAALRNSERMEARLMKKFPGVIPGTLLRVMAKANGRICYEYDLKSIGYWKTVKGDWRNDKIGVVYLTVADAAAHLVDDVLGSLDLS